MIVAATTGSPWLNALPPFLIASAVCIAAVPGSMWLARRTGAVAQPDGDRHLHARPTPRLGGIALFIGFAVAIAIFGSGITDRWQVVAVTGDGVNDAPALKRASIGVSMGEGGTDVARAASVMILLDDSFASIVEAVELGRAVFQNIRKFLIYLFSHNLAELAPILVAVFVGFPLVPLSALQVLSIDLGSDVLPALALGAEPPEPGIMSRQPRPPSEQLFNWAVVRRFAFLGTIQSCGVVFAFFWKIHSAHLAFSAFTSTNPTYREALTMTQAGIVVSQFFNSFAVRGDEESIFRIGVFSNRPLIAAECIGIGFMAAVSYVPALQSVFNTAPLKLSDWLVLVSWGVLLLVCEEARKSWRRSRRRREPPSPVVTPDIARSSTGGFPSTEVAGKAASQARRSNTGKET